MLLCRGRRGNAISRACRRRSASAADVAKGTVAMQTTVAIVAMGEMGAGLAKRLASRGARARTSLEGRGEGSARRARDAGVDVFENDRALIDGADFFFSVVPPAAAVALARRLAPAMRTIDRAPTYVDCNAVSPATVGEVAGILAGSGCGFADGGILGFPPKDDGSGPRIYLSGPAAPEVATLAEFGLDLRVLDDKIGSASALKCSYAALGKGLTALATLLIRGAQHAGVEAALRQELSAFQPHILEWFRRMVPDMYGKSHRWIGEMQEIAIFLDALPGGGATYRGIATLFEAMAQAGRERGMPENDIDAVDAFLAPASTPIAPPR
jgi:putative dehydrogenase